MSSMKRLLLLAAFSAVAAMAPIATATAATFAPAGAKIAVDGSSLSLAMTGATTLPVVCGSADTTGTLASPPGATAAIGVPAFAACSRPGFPAGMYADVTASGTWSLEATSTTAVTLKGSGLQVAVGAINEKTGEHIAPSCILNLSAALSVSGSWSNATHQLTVSNKPFSYVPVAPSNLMSCWVFGLTNGPSGGVQAGKFSGSFTLSNASNPGNPITVQP